MHGRHRRRDPRPGRPRRHLLQPGPAAHLLLDPALVHALINRGNLHLRTENFERALEDYDSAIFYSQGRSALAFYNRSLLHERAGRMTEAREDLLRAIQLQPESREYREALATLE